MARIRIYKKDGTATQYFWSDRDHAHPTQKTVYKSTSTGVKRMTGVHFDAATRKIQKH